MAPQLKDKTQVGRVISRFNGMVGIRRYRVTVPTSCRKLRLDVFASGRGRSAGAPCPLPDVRFYEEVFSAQKRSLYSASQFLNDIVRLVCRVSITTNCLLTVEAKEFRHLPTGDRIKKMSQKICRGGTLWPPLVLMEDVDVARGGHGGPPLVLMEDVDVASVGTLWPPLVLMEDVNAARGGTLWPPLVLMEDVDAARGGTLWPPLVLMEHVDAARGGTLWPPLVLMEDVDVARGGTLWPPLVLMEDVDVARGGTLWLPSF